MIMLIISTVMLYQRQTSHIPHLILTSIQNQTLHTAHLHNKVTLVHFWATTCPSCIQEMAQLVKMHHQFSQQGFDIIAVAVQQNSPDFVLDYVKKNPLPFFVTLDTNGEIANTFGGVSLIPTSFLINKEGEIIQKYVGVPDFGLLHQRIRENIKHKF